MVGRFRGNEREYVTSVLSEFDSGKGYLSGFYKNFNGGKWVQRFEEAFAKYIGVKHAIAVSSGTAALHTAIRALSRIGHRPGTPMLTTAATFVASASSILMADGFPVFCDVSPRTYTMDPFTYDNGKHKLPRPLYIVAVHLLGHPCDMQALHDKFPDARIIEDCAQSLGAKYRGKQTGTIGDISCFSFQETKTLTTLGEGGMICTDSDIYADNCRSMRNHGEKYIRDPLFLGYNYRMTEAAAAFGLAQLEHLNETMKTQIECAHEVRDNLPDFLEPLWVEEWADPSFFIVAAKVKQPDQAIYRHGWIERAMKTLNWEMPEPGKTIGPGYSELVPDLLFFKHLTPYYNWEFPVARHMMNRMIWFDLHRWTDKQTVRERMNKLKEIALVPEN